MTELACLAMVMFMECRSPKCDDMDRIAVAHVALNRAKDRTGEFRNRNTVCEVIAQPGHFPWYGKKLRLHNKLEEQAWYRANFLSSMILMGRLPDPTLGAKWFYKAQENPDNYPEWTTKLETISLGTDQHTFWRKPS